MRSKAFFSSAALVAALVLHGAPPEAIQVPDGGKVILSTTELRVTGNQENAIQFGIRQDIENPAGGPVARAEVTRNEPQWSLWSMSFGGRADSAVGKGDTLLLELYARTPFTEAESAESMVTLTVKHTDFWSQESSVLVKDISFGTGWKRFLIPMETAYAYEAGKLAVNINFGGSYVQDIEVAGFRLITYGQELPIEKLPVTRETYTGMEPDAPWRKAAAERIAKYRMADLRIVVVDAQGNPIPNAAVSAILEKHRFQFGATLISDSRNDPKLQEAHRRLFQTGVVPNALKWMWKDFPERIKAGEETLDWFDAYDYDIRAHTMTWGNYRRVPDDLMALKDDPEAAREFILSYVHDLAKKYKGRIPEWDVINEPYNGTFLSDVLGWDFLADVFKEVRQADPGLKLYINDHAIIAGNDSAHRNAYHKIIQDILDQGGPIDGIGMQGHFNSPLSPEEIYRRLEQFAAFGLEMKITEFDARITDPQIQANFVRDFMTIVFSHPQTAGIIAWIWSPAQGPRQWQSALFFDRDWNIRPNGEAWERLVKHEWHTDAFGRTNGEGAFQVRGYHGDYRVSVAKDGVTREARTKLDPGGRTLYITLE